MKYILVLLLLVSSAIAQEKRIQDIYAFGFSDKPVVMTDHILPSPDISRNIGEYFIAYDLGKYMSGALNITVYGYMPYGSGVEICSFPTHQRENWYSENIDTVYGSCPARFSIRSVLASLEYDLRRAFNFNIHKIVVNLPDSTKQICLLRMIEGNNWQNGIPVRIDSVTIGSRTFHISPCTNRAYRFIYGNRLIQSDINGKKYK